MDPILEHHFYNIANGTAKVNEDGTLSTVKTVIVDIDGRQTLIPTIWDGEEQPIPVAVDNALKSGVNWPKAFGETAIQQLEEQDAEIHSFTDEDGKLLMSDDYTPEEAQEILDVIQQEYDDKDEGEEFGFKDALKLGGAAGLLGLEKLGVDTSPIINLYKGGDTGFNKGGFVTRPVEPVMEVDGGFLVLTPEKHEDGAPVWRYIPEDVPELRESVRPMLRPKMSEEEMRQAFYETKDEMVRQAAIEAGLAEPDKFAKNEYALGGVATATKGITTEEGREMAAKKFQLDDKKADLNENGEVDSYERARGEAIQRNVDSEVLEDEKVQMYHGGMACGCDECTGGMGEGIAGYDEVSGNPIPVGSSATNVRDDIEAMISEGEYVLPAHVVSWHGLKHIMDMQAEAEMGLMSMEMDGLIQHVEQSEMEEVADEEIDVPEEDVDVEVATVEVEDQLEDTEEELEPVSKPLPAMLKKQKIAFMV